MIKAYFYRFNKKVSSTAQPTGEGKEFRIVFKGNVSVTSPVIELSNTALTYNYCYIPVLHRYYWVQNVVVETNDLVVYSLTVDVLATYQEDISNARLYVLRSASQYDTMLSDTVPTHSARYYENATTGTLAGFSRTGCYIVQIVGNEEKATANPASTMYAFTPSNFTNFISQMFKADKYSDLSEIDLTYFNPFQYIVSAKWFPFSAGTLGEETVSKIKYGWFEVDGTAQLVTTYGLELNNTFSIGPSLDNCDWTDRDNNWTNYTLYVPSCGITQIDACYSGTTMNCKLLVDLNTGNSNAIGTIVGDVENKIVFQSNGIIGFDVNINQIAIEPKLNLTTGIKALLGSQASLKSKASKGTLSLGIGGAILQGLFGDNDGIATAIETGTNPTVERFNNIDFGNTPAEAISEANVATILNPTVSSTGTDGARYTIMKMPDYILYKRKYGIFSTSVYEFTGRPCMSVHTLGNLTGYTQCANGQIKTNATIEERNAITNCLESGVWLEW